MQFFWTWGQSITVAEPQSKPQFLVHAKVRLNRLDHLIDECDIIPVRISPAIIQTLRRNENRGLVRKSPETVIVPYVALDSLTCCDVCHCPAIPVESENEPVRLGLVVILGNSEGVLALLSGHSHGLYAACEGRRLSTTSGVCGHSVDKREEEQDRCRGEETQQHLR